VHLLTLWRILRKPTVEKRSASQGEGEPADGHEMLTAEIAQEAGTRWTPVGPLRLPAWTSAGLLAAIPMLLLATAVAGFVAGEQTAFLTLTISLFALFLVVTLWIDTGRSLGSAAGAVLTAAGLALVVGAVLVGIAFAQRSLAGRGGFSTEESLTRITEVEACNSGVAGGGLSGWDISGCSFEKRNM